MNYFLFLPILFVFLFSGCTAIDENRYSINQLRNRMMNVESALSKQNLMVQQNKAEIDNLYDRDDEMMRLIKSRKRVSSSSSFKKSSASGILPKILRGKNSNILSDKLTENVTVYDVQKALKNAGFYVGKIDGKAGSMTKNAIERFQRANGLEDDGIVGNRTWNLLKRYI